jgi:exosortase
MALDSLSGYCTLWHEDVRKLFKMMMNTVDGSKQIAAESVTQSVRGPNKLSGSDLYFWSFVVMSCLVFWVSIRNLIAFSLAHDYASHVLLIAPLSIFLIYLRRREIFSIQVGSNRRTTIIAGSGLFLLGLSFLLASKCQPLSAEKLSLEILALVVLWISAFVFCYGTESFIKARFPLLFLLLLVPFPEFIIQRTIFALQVGSSDVAYGLLRILNVPVLKEGFILRLPMVSLEVAKECSGIRSSIALLVTMLVAAEFALRSPWSKMLLVVAIIPILVIKNGVRIVTIYLLAAYVDPAFLHGWLHTSGGIVFYVLGLVALIPVTVLLRRWERKGISLPPVHRLAHAI